MIIPSFAQESSFDDQLVNSEEYSKILNRLHSLENQNSEFTHEFQNFGNIFTSKLTEMNTSLVESGNIANKSLWLGLYVSIIFASIAIFATLWNAKVLRGQTNKIEQDVNARIRPILGRKFVNSSGTYGLKPEKMLIHLTNTGTLPALYLKMKNYVEIKNEPPENFSPNFSFDKKDNAQKYHAMGPNEFYSFDIFWPKDENNYHLLASTGKTVYFGLIIWYEDKHDHKGTEYFYHMEGHLDNGALMLDYMNMN
jgi:hypothetical protein